MEQQSADAKELARFGYRSEFKREFGSFSSFCVSFSWISILTGVFTAFGLGYGFAGPAFIWTWPIVLGAQLIVALNLAQLASSYPLAGSLYQWSKQLAGKAWSWHTGWIYLAAIIVGVASLGVATQSVMTQISPDFQFFGSGVPGILDSDFARNAVLLGFVLLVISTFINSMGPRTLSRANNIGVTCELVGIIVLIVLLATHLHHGPDLWFKTLGTGAGHASGWIGAALIGAFMALYTMFGMEGASSLSEETKEPTKTAPKAILRALLASGILGFIAIALAILAIKNPSDADVSALGLPHIVEQNFGSTAGTLFLIDVMIAIIACTLAVQAQAIRMVFGMSRDGLLPFAHRFSDLSKRTDAPVAAAVLTGLLAFALMFTNLANPKAFQALLAMVVILIYIAYLGVLVPLLRRRLDTDGPLGSGRWRFRRRSGIILNVVGICWLVAGAVNLAWPRAEFYGTAFYQQYSAVIFVPAIILVGALYYVARQRQRPVVILQEHAVEDARDGELAHEALDEAIV